MGYKRTDNEIIIMMLEYIHSIETSLRTTDNFEQFISNIDKRDACTMRLEKTCELSLKISPELRNQNMHIKWNEMKGLRNRLAHVYENTSFEIIWNILKDYIPILKDDLTEIHNNL